MPVFGLLTSPSVAPKSTRSHQREEHCLSNCEQATDEGVSYAGRRVLWTWKDWKAVTMTISDHPAANRITVQIPTASGDVIEAWVYLPEGSGPHPAV